MLKEKQGYKKLMSVMDAKYALPSAWVKIFFPNITPSALLSLAVVYIFSFNQCSLYYLSNV
jgi:hypothetical protein